MKSLSHLLQILFYFAVSQKLFCSTTFNAFVTSSDGYVYFFDTSLLPAPPVEISRIQIGNGRGAGNLIATQDGRFIFVCVSDLGKVVKASTTDLGANVWNIYLPANKPNWIADCHDIVKSPDEKYAYIVSEMLDQNGSAQYVGNLCRIDLETNQAVFLYAFSDVPVALAMSSASLNLIYVSSWNPITEKTMLTTIDISGSSPQAISSSEISGLIPLSGTDPAVCGLSISTDEQSLYVLCNLSSSSQGTPAIFKYDLSTPAAPTFVSAVLGYDDFKWGQLVFPLDTNSYGWAGISSTGLGYILTPTSLDTGSFTLSKTLSNQSGLNRGATFDENYVYFPSSSSNLYYYERSVAAPAFLTDSPYQLILSDTDAQLNYIKLAPVYLPPPPPAPPEDIKGEQQKNDFGTEYDLMNVISWSPSSSIIAGYDVYKNNQKIARLSNSSFFFIDQSVSKGIAITYKITAFNAAGQESPSAEITIK